MKRPQLIVVYAPVPIPPDGLANAVLDSTLGESNGYLMHYYARLEFLPDDDSYDAAEESLDLKGRDDLLRRVQRDQDSVWTSYVSVGFYPAEVFFMIFRDPAGGPASTLVLRIGGVITKSVEDEEDSRIPVALFLARVAKAVGSDWFISGPYIEEFRPVTLEQLANRQELGRLYIIGWKTGAPQEEAILSTLNLKPETVKRTTLDYNVVIDVPG